MVAAILFIVFVCTGKFIPEKYRGITIYGIMLALLYAVTIQGINVAGTDVSGELATSRIVIQNGWDLSLGDTNNTSFVVAWLVPLFGIRPELVYKFILPLGLAGVPAMLYMMFKKLVDDNKALYSVMFFISVPVMQTEIIMIGKSMAGELLMACAFFLVMVRTNRWIKFPAILGLGLLAAWAHYSIGFLLVAYLTSIGIFLLIKKRKDAVFYLGVSTIMVLGMWVYYSIVSQGQIIGVIVDIIKKMAFATGKINNQISFPLHLLGLVLGIDFFDVGWAGKAFRIAQYITQALVLLGSWLVIRSKIGEEYKAGVVASLFILIYCMALPPFASILNVTRFYHITLFFLAPALVIGFDWVYRKINHV